MRWSVGHVYLGGYLGLVFLPSYVGVEVPDAENCHLANTTADVQCAGLLPDLGHYYYIFQVDFIPEYSTWSTRYQNTVTHITRVQYLEHSIAEYST